MYPPTLPTPPFLPSFQVEGPGAGREAAGAVPWLHASALTTQGTSGCPERRGSRALGNQHVSKGREAGSWVFTVRETALPPSAPVCEKHEAARVQALSQAELGLCTCSVPLFHPLPGQLRTESRRLKHPVPHTARKLGSINLRVLT